MKPNSRLFVSFPPPPSAAAALAANTEENNFPCVGKRSSLPLLLLAGVGERTRWMSLSERWAGQSDRWADYTSRPSSRGRERHLACRRTTFICRHLTDTGGVERAVGPRPRTEGRRDVGASLSRLQGGFFFSPLSDGHVANA